MQKAWLGRGVGYGWAEVYRVPLPLNEGSEEPARPTHQRKNKIEFFVTISCILVLEIFET